VNEKRDLSIMFWYLVLGVCLSVVVEPGCAVKHLGSWMNIGMQGYSVIAQPEQYKKQYKEGKYSTYSTLETSPNICTKINGLSSGQQKLCMLYTDHMLHVGRGARSGIGECQYQFRNRRWNCSTVEDTTVFGPVLSIPSKEAAFAHAVASAGVVHSVSRGCRDGQLASCGCSGANRPGELKSEWIWGGCGDNIQYGYKFAQNFIDIREREGQGRKAGQSKMQGRQAGGRNLMNLHNNEAGRRAVISNMKITCKCHGVSGSCSLVTCWQQLAPFRVVGDFLRSKYSSATKVKPTGKGRLRLHKRSIKIPTANDLIFIKTSPDYCHRDNSTGSLGTSGRVCSVDSDGMDSCDVMCCGRGYNTVNTRVKERCKCKFHWCCYVECQTCTKPVQLNVCK